MLLALRSLATQACACLQPRRKRPRRASDDDGSQLETDGDELDILIDGGGGSSSSNSGELDELDELLVPRAFAKRSSKSAALAVESSSSCCESTSTAARLLGRTSGEPLSVERNLDVLRSYQQVTGVVDEGESDLECVMCLDTFSAVNPKVRTLCSCGVNRTNFHMSCLLEWKNRAAKCPVCREYLFYED